MKSVNLESLVEVYEYYANEGHFCGTEIGR